MRVRYTVPALVLVGTLLLAPEAVLAQGCEPPSFTEDPSSGAQPPTNADWIHYRMVPGFPSAVTTQVRNAHKRWNAPWCNTDGNDFPMFDYMGSAANGPISGFDGTSIYNIKIRYVTGNGPLVGGLPACAETLQGVIKLYERNANGVDCPTKLVADGTATPAQIEVFIDMMNHEFGHRLGLGHVGGNSCKNNIMYGGPLQWSNNLWHIRPNECKKADEINRTVAEMIEECQANPVNCVLSTTAVPFGPIIENGPLVPPMSVPPLLGPGPTGPWLAPCVNQLACIYIPNMGDPNGSYTEACWTKCL